MIIMSVLGKISNFFKSPPENKTTIRVRGYIGKFVRKNNDNIGESIAIENGRIIIKNSENVMSLPMETIIKNSETLVVGDFDMEESIRLGKEWAERKDVLKFDDKGMLIK